MESATRLTYKFLCAGEVKKLDEAEVVSSNQAEASVRNTSAVYVGFFSVPRPNSENLVTQDTAKQTSMS